MMGLCMLAMPVSSLLGGCNAGQDAGSLLEGPVGQTEQALTTCVTIRRGNGTAADARLSKNAKNTNFGSNPVLQVGEDDHTLIRFDLSSIPSSAVINSATLKVYAHGHGNGNGNGNGHGDGCGDDDDDGRIRIHRAKAAWSEGSVTYKNFNNQYDSAVAGTLVSHNHTALQSASVKGLVSQWASGAQPNHGFLLENKQGDDKTNFVSSESNNPALRPALEVCYTTPDDNHCDPNPCVHGACSNQQNGYSCACDAGWSGANCDVNIDDCAGAPCQNGGTCTDQANGYTCSCPAGYTGDNCEIDIDECASSPCVNGDCTDQVNGYECACNPGFSGTNCDVNIDDCAGAPCQHGGTCTDQTNGYTCACPAGYTGDNCEIDIDECGSSPCANGMCIDGVNAFTCVCDPGFSGTLCETNTDECAAQPCQNGGTCTDGIFSYTCACPAGYTGDNCEIDIDECGSSPCTNGDCTDLVNSYECGCLPGYTGTNCEYEINECESQPCVNGGDCTDLINGYSCSCPDGFTGTNCETEIDECESAPCVNGDCADQVNGYTCGCWPGFTGTNCDVVDACPVGTAGVNCEATCPCATDGDTETAPHWNGALNGSATAEACQSNGAGTSYVSLGGNYNNSLVLTPGYCRSTNAGNPGRIYSLNADQAAACGTIVNQVNTASNVTCSAADTCPCAGFPQWDRTDAPFCGFQDRSDIGFNQFALTDYVNEYVNGEGPTVFVGFGSAFCYSEAGANVAETTLPQYEACFALLLANDHLGACNSCLQQTCSTMEFCAGTPGSYSCE
jgi:hypothetical protein